MKDRSGIEIGRMAKLLIVVELFSSLKRVNIQSIYLDYVVLYNTYLLLKR